MSSFIALDFETANRNAASVCSVGMVKVIDNMMTEEFYTLVNPETDFSPGNIRVHGIKPEDIEDAPTFKDVFPHMLDFIGKLPVVAHNAQFDMNVLYQSIERYDFEVPTMKYFCSVNMARKTIKNNSYSLKNMMKYYDIDFRGHHHALNDAKACAMVTVRLLKLHPSLDDYLKKNKSYLSGMKNKTSKTAMMNQYNKELLEIKTEKNEFDTSHLFFEKRIGITGTLFKKRKDIVQYIVDHGGTFIADLEQPVDILLYGKQKDGKPSKKEQIIMNKISNGSDITLIGDEKLQQLITFYEMM